MVKFSKFCLENFHRLTNRCCYVNMSENFSDRKSCVIYQREIEYCSLSNCCFCDDRTQNLPGPAPNIWLTMFRLSSKSVHFIADRAKAVLLADRVNP